MDVEARVIADLRRPEQLPYCSCKQIKAGRRHVGLPFKRDRDGTKVEIGVDVQARLDTETAMARCTEPLDFVDC